MTGIRYLLDENMSHGVRDQLLYHEPTLPGKQKRGQVLYFRASNPGEYSKIGDFKIIRKEILKKKR